MSGYERMVARKAKGIRARRAAAQLRESPRVSAYRDQLMAITFGPIFEGIPPEELRWRLEQAWKSELEITQSRAESLAMAESRAEALALIAEYKAQA
jgi:hypothetical protein